MAYLNWILAWFEALSRLKINLDKSSLRQVVGRVENGENLALELGCKIGSLPTEYLGHQQSTWGSFWEQNTMLLVCGMG